MGSKTFDGVWFTAYSDDHPPPHVHARTSSIEVVIDLLGNGKVGQSTRPRAVKPVNAKRNDVRHILSVAAANALELEKLWEHTHGTPS